jgi:hypothetical protein
MTQDDAHAALDRFVRQAWKDGRRMLLVITGKGNLGEGVLRRGVRAGSPPASTPRVCSRSRLPSRVMAATAPSMFCCGGRGIAHDSVRREDPRVAAV